MARNISNCKFVKMESLSHVVAIAAPEETLELVRGFLVGFRGGGGFRLETEVVGPCVDESERLKGNHHAFLLER